MKDFGGKIQYNGEEYGLVFNLNVMEQIQAEYGTIEKWGALTDGVSGEPDAKAIIFGFREMLNEAIDIENDENGTDKPPLSLKKVGRIITDIGLANATTELNKTVVESTQSEEKNE
jgi:hypothetical protein